MSARIPDIVIVTEFTDGVRYRLMATLLRRALRLT